MFERVYDKKDYFNTENSFQVFLVVSSNFEEALREIFLYKKKKTLKCHS
jgi:hypothetical protein